MADSNSKRAKMDNPSGSSSSESSGSSPEDHEIDPKGKIVNICTQSFEVIRNMRGFVDHTHFIWRFLRTNHQNLAIFAPRRFGKSSHLDMMKKFLEIEVDKTTGDIPSTVNGPPEERKNYKLFMTTQIGKNANYNHVLKKHLGKHPVIHLDFKTTSVGSVEEALEHCRNAVHNAYLEHPYLKRSEKLIPDDKEANAQVQIICEQWCDEFSYQKQNLERCLENLARFLYNHFDGAKVYILVDEFDAINASALWKVRGNNMNDTTRKLQDICNILVDMLGPVTNGNDAHVAGTLVTGVSYMSGLGYSALWNNVRKIKFLECGKSWPLYRDLVPFYGATKNEVMSLIQKLAQDKQLVMFEGKEKFLNDTQELDVDKIMADVESRYNGYVDMNGTRIFCLWSVLQYLESGNPRNYWNQTDGVEGLFKILNCGKVAYEIMKLMRWENIKLKRYDKITVENLVELHDLFLDELVRNEYKVDPEIVLNFLVDQGYLSYSEKIKPLKPLKPQVQKFKLPNAEIRAALSNMIRGVVKDFWKIDTTSCTSLIEDISSSLMKNEKWLQNNMLFVYAGISEILRPLLEQKNHTLVNEAKMLCVMHKTLDDANSFELADDLRINDVEGTSVTSERPDFLLLHKDDQKFAILWELRYKKESMKDKYTSSLYALQEARGIVATKNGETKMYMDSLKKLGREALVIGLSMDCDRKVSLSYSSGMEEKIFSISETEHTLYPDLYKTYNPVLLLKEKNDY